MEAAGLEPANPGVANPEPFQHFAPIITFEREGSAIAPLFVQATTGACWWSTDRVRSQTDLRLKVWSPWLVGFRLGPVLEHRPRVCFSGVASLRSQSTLHRRPWPGDDVALPFEVEHQYVVVHVDLIPAGYARIDLIVLTKRLACN